MLVLNYHIHTKTDISDFFEDENSQKPKKGKIKPFGSFESLFYDYLLIGN